MKENTIALTKDELTMLWCSTYENMTYWRDLFINTQDKEDLRMYHIARSIYGKIHRASDNTIITSIKGISNKKYKMIWKGVK